MKYIREHKKASVIIALAAIVLLAFLGLQRKNATSQSVFDTLKDAPRGEAIEENKYYSGQLTQREYEDYEFLRQKMENLEGGVLTLPNPLSGKEYQRILTALEYEGNNYFYGFVDIPMTEDGVYVFHKDKDPFRLVDQKIAKVVLFLSCAEGIELFGQFADDGTLINIEEIQKGFSVNDEEKVKKIREMQEETEKVMDEIIAGIPENAGDKTTADYFCKWLDENVKLADDAAQKAQELDDMGDMLEQVYPYNHLVALSGKKASILGYGKIFSELCRRAGIESHVVMGTWNSQWTDWYVHVRFLPGYDVRSSGSSSCYVPHSKRHKEKSGSRSSSFRSYRFFLQRCYRASGILFHVPCTSTLWYPCSTDRYFYGSCSCASCASRIQLQCRFH